MQEDMTVVVKKPRTSRICAHAPFAGPVRSQQGKAACGTFAI
jgi:hypothetical protein